MEEIFSPMKINYLLAQHSHLETQRLILRPVTLGDAPDIYRYAKSTSNTRFIFPPHESLTDTLERTADYFGKEPLGKFAIALKETNQLIGTIDLRVKENRQAEIGYALNADYWGQGIMPEACHALLDLSFNTLRLVHVYADCLELNVNSARVMEKVGLRLEARIPKARFFEGQWVTSLQYGMTDEEYFTEVNQHLFPK
ncbi:GNAT family N-acetyltransferase [Enterococcus nangangensis]|uniref:GNAT family N-acetyltransferase n=1 Tax=Enterococcus nangangensis TaxID=2559926 RepID=UPI0010F4EACF|nr:GNAT family protein [Enterococcus nangangensis]